MVLGSLKSRLLSHRVLEKEQLYAENQLGWAVLWRKGLLHPYLLLSFNCFSQRLSALLCPPASTAQGEKKAFSGCSVDPIDEVHGAYFTLLVTALEHY